MTHDLHLDVNAYEFTPEYTYGTYSPKDALAFALACELAYTIKDADKGGSDFVAKKLKEQWHFSEVTIINKFLSDDIDTQGFVASNDNHILVTFCGSESSEDWWTNLTFTSETGPFRGTKVHKGFQDALVPTLIRIASDAQRYNPASSKQIWIAGHSLGGALAVLLTAMLIADDVPVAGLYTYGAPRVGDKAFEEACNQRFTNAFRVVNEDDMVPHLPPEFLGYSHTGQRVLFSRDGIRREDSNTWQDFRAKMGSWIYKATQAEVKIGDPHRLATSEGYLKKLKHDFGKAMSNLL
jgi:triacylglycerol lipase